MYKIQSARRLAHDDRFLQSSPRQMGVTHKEQRKRERVQSVKIPPTGVPPPSAGEIKKGPLEVLQMLGGMLLANDVWGGGGSDGT